MIEKGKIGVHQFTILTVLFTVGSSILIAPSGLAHDAKQDAWIAAALGLGVGLLTILLYNRITVRYPSKTLVACCQEAFGAWVGGFISFLYFGYFFMLAALVLRNIGDFMTTQVLPNTPIQFIHALFLFVVIMGLRNGLETITRTAEIFLPWVLFFFLIMVVLLPPKFDYHNLLPVFGYGMKPTVRASIPLISTPYMELIVFLMIFPHVSNAPKARKAFLAGTFIGGMLLVVIALLSILVLGSELTARHLYPSYSLAKKISIGKFLERLEVVMAGIWFITIYFKLAICFYGSATTLAELFKLKEVKQLYLPLGIIIIVFSVVAYPNIAYFMLFGSKIDFPYSFPYAYIIPFALLLTARFRNKNMRQ
ncbi:endospore germination permease [Paenibacillus allorhizosphaerae]|uniref:Spore germination protein YndE n=1 Tax=Paenibacillus allorhizosphaerae TaxID=2849866 RepID=A0ABN7TR02_9BACL|nr:endospore germination permease [Paenibacillus allorhizosphaerae]CAG7646902.1 Spore germination protein YndE [Paenibacillus allorhizosphaerae]